MVLPDPVEKVINNKEVDMNQYRWRMVVYV